MMLTTRIHRGTRPKATKNPGVKKSPPATIPAQPSYFGRLPWRTAEIPLAIAIVPRPTGKNMKRL